jgi:osmotically-inducible protein OsmY
VAPRGPKGWVRSDERILDELCERIVRAGVDASELEISVDGGAVRVEGTLATSAERARVVDLAERTLGVVSIDADVFVREAADDPRGEEKEPTWH